MSRPSTHQTSAADSRAWARFALRQNAFNQVMVFVGVLSLHAAEVMSPSKGATLGWLYNLFWLELVGLFGVLLTANCLYGVAQRGWLRGHIPESRLDEKGRYGALPGMVKMRLLMAAAACPVAAAWLAQQAFLSVLASQWGREVLPQAYPSYAATWFNSAYGTVAACIFELLHEQWRLRKQREQVARKLSAEAQLQLLRSQLDPHMLFNTLSNLYELIEDNPRQAQSMLLHLIHFLRSTLHGSLHAQHALADEFKLAADYLSLMRIRMGERLRTRLDLPDELRAAAIPALLLQPLIENAIKHGLEHRVEGGDLSVSASAEAGQLVLRVANSGAMDAQAASWAESGESQGFGLRSVQDRLRMLCGPDSDLELAHLQDVDTTLATLRLPLLVQEQAA